MARRAETELFLNPGFIPWLLLCFGLGAGGGWARRAMIKRFKHDPAIEATGACVLLFAGAAWGIAARDNPQAGVAGVVLALLALALTFTTIGAFTLGGETRSTIAWVRYVLLVVLVFGLIVFALIVWLGMSLQGASFA